MLKPPERGEIMPKCPVCGAELKPVGYPVDGWQYYECPNGCEFEKPLSWKIADGIAVVIFLILMTIVIILTLPFHVSYLLKQRKG